MHNYKRNYLYNITTSIPTPDGVRLVHRKAIESEVLLMNDVKYEYGCEITSASKCPLRKEIEAEVIDDTFILLLGLFREVYEYPNREIKELCIALLEDAIETIRGV